MSEPDAVAYCRANESGNWSDLAHATGWPITSLRVVCKKAGFKKTPNKPPVSAASRAREGTPAADLPASDRDELVETARLTRQAILHEVRAIRERQKRPSSLVSDDKQLPAIDKNTAVSMNAMSGMLRNLLAAHPGLMAEVNKAEGGTSKDNDETARRLAEAYPVKSGK